MDAEYLKSNVDIKNIINHVGDKDYFLPKTTLALDNAKTQMYVFELDISDGGEIGIKPKRDHIAYTKYLHGITKGIYHDMSSFTIRSSFLSRLNEFKSALDIDLLNNRNYLLWYTYGFNRGVQSDILALICMLEKVPDLSHWIAGKGSRKFKEYSSFIERFINQHSNQISDIYFLWSLWADIKEQLIKSGILSQYIIGTDIMSTFLTNKSKYLAGEEISKDQFEIFQTLYTSNKLNGMDEIYNYVSVSKPQNTLALSKPVLELRGTPTISGSKIHLSGEFTAVNIDYLITHISSMYNINPDLLIQFITLYLRLVSETEKKIWMYNYAYQHNMLEDTTNNIMEWINKLRLRSLVSNPKPWDSVFESYLRAYSTNLVRFDGKTYWKIDRGFAIYPQNWNKFIFLEKTFVNSKTEYLIYHSERALSDSTNIIYLTPIKLEWILELNPIYYYYFLFDSKRILTMIRNPEDQDKTQKIMQQIKKSFSMSDLLDYINILNIPALSNIIHRKIMRNI